MKAKFNLGCALIAAADTSSGAWTSAQLDLSVSDFEGVWLGTDLVAGDVVMLDTGSFEPGTITEYLVTGALQKQASFVRVSVSLRNTDHPAPDLGYVIGSRGYIARPTSKGGLVSVPAPGVQGLPDKFAWGGHNRNVSALGGVPVMSDIVYAAGKVASWTVGADSFNATYGSNGLVAITRNGSPYINVTYSNGLPTAVTAA